MPQRDMTIQKFMSILDALPTLQHIELQGEGEPLLNPAFFDMVALARARGIDVSFISNGSLFTSRRIERLLDLDIRKIGISIDSAEPDVFRNIRGGSLAKVVRGVRQLLTRRSERNLVVPLVGLQVTLLRQTLNALPDIVALYKQLGLDGGLGLQPLQRMVSYTDTYDEAMQHELSLCDEQLHSFYDANASLLSEMRRENAARAQGFYAELFAGWRPEQAQCPWLERAAYFSVDGIYSPCCTIKNPRRHGLRTGLAGDSVPINETRAVLARKLREGCMPSACEGCTIASHVVERVHA